MRLGLLMTALWACGGSYGVKGPDTGGSAGVVEDCFNGIDDDEDGALDCADSDCWSEGVCPEDCSNGVDDDGDGAADCADSDCDGGCAEICDDGRDNDGDGDVDCLDDDCAGACPEDCSNGVDDDGDALVDCLDDDCSDVCPEDCLNGSDDDFDGLVDCDDDECESTCDADGDGWVSEALGGEDCDDSNPDVNPDGTEVCGNGDDDCDGLVDEEDSDIDPSSLTFFYPDGDFDGWGAVGAPYPACFAPPGYVESTGDCDDGNNGIYPSQVERCNFQDDDCDGLVDDEDDDIDPDTQLELYEDLDGDGMGGELVLRCWPEDGYVDEPGDCDDLDPFLSTPGDWWLDADGDGYGTGVIEGPECDAPSPSHVLVVLGEDCRDDDPAISPGVDEICDNGIDDDCDDVVDGLFGHDGACLGCGAASALAYEPAMYWRMETDSGLMRDAVLGSSLDGSLTGTPTLYSGVAADEAWGLDGDDFVYASSWEEVPRDRWTVSLFVRSDDRDVGLLQYASTGATRDLSLALSASGELVVAVVDSEHTFPVVVADGAWHHVVVTWDTLGGRTELFVDGSARGSAILGDSRRLTFAGTLSAGVGQSCIACFDEPLIGVLDEVAIFPRVLTRDQIMDVYRGTTCDEGTRCNGLDDDDDGLVDEHLVGQPGCPASGCGEVFGADAWYGPMVYDLDAGDLVCE